MNNKSEDVRLNAFKLNNVLILVMAVVSGAAVANLYYVQPLLAEIAKTFHVSQVSVGSVMMLTQAGYAIGMLLLLPLADIKEKKFLIILMLLCAACSLMMMAFASLITVILIVSFAIGFTSVVPQLIVPLAAQLSDPKDRGRIIGMVMSGLFIGILASRTFSGFMGEYYSWRYVYMIASGLMILMAIILGRLLPVCPPITKMRYLDLFKSIIQLVKTLAPLREASIGGAMMFAAFSAFWTTLVFLLQSPHYNMGPGAAGLFGIIGISGAIAAPIVGRAADKRTPKFTFGIGMSIVIASYICFFALGFQLWGLIIGVILLDVGVQSCQISNQAKIHSLSDEARNRINTVYMVTYFIGGALGSILGSYFYSVFGWYGVCMFGLGTQIFAVINHKLHKAVPIQVV